MIKNIIINQIELIIKNKIIKIRNFSQKNFLEKLILVVMNNIKSKDPLNIKIKIKIKKKKKKKKKIRKKLCFLIVKWIKIRMKI